MWARLIGATTLGAVAVVAAVQLGLSASLSSRSVDEGIHSAFAIVSNDPVDAIQSQVDILNVSPEPAVPGRLSFHVAVGQFASGEAVEPDASIYPSTRGSGKEPGAPAGVAIVLGGRLADALGACDGDEATSIVRKVSYSSLTEIERNSIVANLTEQEKDRVVAYGDLPAGSGRVTAAETAEGMHFTVIEFPELTPNTWTMATKPVTSDAGSAPPTQGSISVAGYRGLAQCRYTQASLFTTQQWGKRFEFPPITVATLTRAGATDTEAESVRDLYAFRDTPDFRYISQYSLASSKTLENFGGATGQEDQQDAWQDDADPVPTASVTQLAMGYQYVNFTQDRDLKIFAAGALASLAASLLIAIVKTIASRFFDRKRIEAQPAP
jgi:hypothetical protein